MTQRPDLVQLTLITTIGNMDREGNDFLTFHLHNIKNESELSLVAVHTQLLNMGRKCSKNVSKNMRHKMQEEVKIGWIFSVVCM